MSEAKLLDYIHSVVFPTSQLLYTKEVPVQRLGKDGGDVSPLKSAMKQYFGEPHPNTLIPVYS